MLNRPKRICTSTANIPVYHDGPFHGEKKNGRGTWMEVTLGPNAAFFNNLGSKTNYMSLRSLMQALKEKGDDRRWIAGHLLNYMLGGSGTNPKNLVPLTHAANMKHSTLEGRIKQACTAAHNYHEQHPDADFWYGIDYQVSASAEVVKLEKTYDKVPKFIVLEAELWEIDKTTRNRTQSTTTNSQLIAANFQEIITNDLV